jgi:hypothetical protein
MGAARVAKDATGANAENKVSMENSSNEAMANGIASCPEELHGKRMPIYVQKAACVHDIDEDSKAFLMQVEGISCALYVTSLFLYSSQIHAHAISPLY